MRFNIRSYVSGTITIKVSGAMPEKFINLCMMEKKNLLQITKINDDFIVCMYLTDFFSIRPLVRKSQNSVRVIHYSGLPFMMRKIKRRKMFLIGAVACLMLLNISISYIWFVDIIGVNSIPPKQIKELVYQHGLRPGVLKDAVTIKNIENQILFSIPEVAWVGITFTGTRAVVEIVEKTIPKQQDKAPADIIATKDGIITEVITLAGQSVVKKGDTVKKGDILIRGITNPALQLIRANGIAKARIWYESYGESELVKTIYERTGRQQTGIKFRIGQYEIPLKQVTMSTQAQFEVEIINKKLFGWRNSDFVVESIISAYYETNPKTIESSIEEAREQGKILALAKVQSLIPETAEVLSRTIEILKTPETNLVRVKVNVETIEDIGEFMNIP